MLWHEKVLLEILKTCLVQPICINLSITWLKFLLLGFFRLVKVIFVVESYTWTTWTHRKGEKEIHLNLDDHSLQNSDKDWKLSSFSSTICLWVIVFGCRFSLPICIFVIWVLWTGKNSYHTSVCVYVCFGCALR